MGFASGGFGGFGDQRYARATDPYGGFGQLAPLQVGQLGINAPQQGGNQPQVTQPMGQPSGYAPPVVFPPPAPYAPPPTSGPRPGGTGVVPPAGTRPGRPGGGGGGHLLLPPDPTKPPPGRGGGGGLIKPY